MTPIERARERYLAQERARHRKRRGTLPERYRHESDRPMFCTNSHTSPKAVSPTSRLSLCYDCMECRRVDQKAAREKKNA